MPASLDPQLALDEKAITNPELEQALERHLRARDDVAEARGVVKVEKKRIDALLESVDDFEPDTALRVGRFRITKRHIEGAHREFDTAPRDQISIGLVDADGNATRRSSGGKPKLHSVSDDEDLRPTGEVNADALRGDADRSLLQ
jgi:hypothetical protein